MVKGTGRTKSLTWAPWMPTTSVLKYESALRLVHSIKPTLYRKRNTAGRYIIQRAVYFIVAGHEIDYRITVCEYWLLHPTQHLLQNVYPFEHNTERCVQVTNPTKTVRGRAFHGRWQPRGPKVLNVLFLYGFGPSLADWDQQATMLYVVLGGYPAHHAGRQPPNLFKMPYTSVGTHTSILTVRPTFLMCDWWKET